MRCYQLKLKLMGRVTDTLTASPFLYAGIQFGMVSNNDVMYLFKQVFNAPRIHHVTRVIRVIGPRSLRNARYTRFSGVNYALYMGA